jgi:hypothetical protein
MAVAAAAALVPMWAMAGNQEVAEQIATALRDSGQLHGYRVGVKYQDGTAWLKGQVANRDDMSNAMQLAFAVPGVTRVVNNLTVRSEQPTESASNDSPSRATGGVASAEQTLPSGSREKAPNRAERLVTAFTPAVEPQVEKTALEEPAMAPPKPVAEGSKEAAVTPQRALKPMPMAYTQAPLPMARVNGQAMPQQTMAIPAGAAPARYDQPNMPNYAWPSYSPYPNYASLTYPKQYSPTAWPYIGPFYPYPQVPLGWRKVTMEWHDGWWNLDFDDGTAKGPFSGLFRPGRRKY